VQAQVRIGPIEETKAITIFQKSLEGRDTLNFLKQMFQ